LPYSHCLFSSSLGIPGIFTDHPQILTAFPGIIVEYPQIPPAIPEFSLIILKFSRHFSNSPGNSRIIADHPQIPPTFPEFSRPSPNSPDIPQILPAFPEFTHHSHWALGGRGFFSFILCLSELMFVLADIPV
jgi:hypothetical protein